jgi:hypothetical protein
MDVGCCLSSYDFAGRPRGGRGLPVFASIALRAAASSFLVIRLAFSKGNSFEFFISLPFAAIRVPGANQTVGFPAPSSCECHYQHSII